MNASFLWFQMRAFAVLPTTVWLFSYNGHGLYLPLLLMGGKDFGFRHGQHLSFQPLEGANPAKGETTEAQNKRRADFKKTPLCNLYVSLTNAMGVPTKSFADSDGELNGLMKS